MSVNITPDAWMEMCQLLENRKQALDNAMVKTLDDKCSASHFQVVRSLMLDQERLLHWFIAQKNSSQDRAISPATGNITKPASQALNSLAKRAGFLKPGLLMILTLVFFFVIVLLSLLQEHFPDGSQYGQNTGNQREIGRDSKYLGSPFAQSGI